MAAGDFTASTSQDILLRMKELFGDSVQANAEFRHELGTAQAIIENQTMRFTEVVEGGKCVGFKTLWLKDCAAQTIYSDTVADATLTCDVPTGQELQSDSKTYTPNRFINARRQVNDDLCNNEYQFIELSAQSMLKGVL